MKPANTAAAPPPGPTTATPAVPQSSAHPKQMMMPQALSSHSGQMPQNDSIPSGSRVMPSTIPPAMPSVLPPSNVGVSISAPRVAVGGSGKVPQVGGARLLGGGAMSNSVGGGFGSQSQQVMMSQDPLTQAMSHNVSQYPVNMPSAFGHTQPMGMEEQSNVNSAFTYGGEHSISQWNFCM